MKWDTEGPITPEHARASWYRRRFLLACKNINIALESSRPTEGLTMTWDDVISPLPALDDKEKQSVWAVYTEKGFKVNGKSGTYLSFESWDAISKKRTNGA